MNPDAISYVQDFIGNTAFPIAVAWFMLTRVEKAVTAIGGKLDSLTDEIRRLPSRAS